MSACDNSSADEALWRAAGRLLHFIEMVLSLRNAVHEFDLLYQFTVLKKNQCTFLFIKLWDINNKVLKSKILDTVE